MISTDFTFWTMIAFPLTGGVLVGIPIGILINNRTTKREAREAAEREERRKLAEKRRLHDAGRTHPKRPDAGPPLVVRKAALRRKR